MQVERDIVRESPYFEQAVAECPDVELHVADAYFAELVQRYGRYIEIDGWSFSPGEVLSRCGEWVEALRLFAERGDEYLYDYKTGSFVRWTDVEEEIERLTHERE